MARATIYPPADHSSQWYGAGNATISPHSILWHTTETAGGWPGYSGGGDAPNLTYDPWAHKWRQHFPLNGTARALLNDGGYQTNRAGVCQIEISCYCDPSKAGTGKTIATLDEQAYADMYAFSKFMQDEWGIPLACSVVFKPYPSSYGNNGVRLSQSAFSNYAGHCGHQHAPGNDHGDPGNLDVSRIIGFSPAPPTPEVPDMTPDETNAAIHAITDPMQSQINGLASQINGLTVQIASLASTVEAYATQGAATLDALGASDVWLAQHARADRMAIYGAVLDDSPLYWDEALVPVPPLDGITEWDSARYWDDADAR